MAVPKTSTTSLPTLPIFLNISPKLLVTLEISSEIPPIDLNVSFICPASFNPDAVCKPFIIVLKSILPTALPRPSPNEVKTVPNGAIMDLTLPNILLKSMLPIALKKSPTPVLSASNLSPMKVKALFKPVPILSNTCSLNAFETVLAKLPIVEVTDNTAEPIEGNTPSKGFNPFTTFPTALPTVLNTSNTPLKVFLIFLAVSSFILNL